LELGNKEEGLV